MPRKTVSQHASKGRKNPRRPPKRIASSAAQDLIKEKMTGRRKRKRALKAANKENEAPIPAPVQDRDIGAAQCPPAVPIQMTKSKVRVISPLISREPSD